MEKCISLSVPKTCTVSWNKLKKRVKAMIHYRRSLNENLLNFKSVDSWRGGESLMAEMEIGNWTFIFQVNLYDSESDETSYLSIDVLNENGSGGRRVYFYDLTDSSDYEFSTEHIAGQLYSYISNHLSDWHDIDSIMHRNNCRQD